MLNVDDLNPYAKGIAMEVFSVHSEWKEFSKAYNQKNGRNSLLIEINPPKTSDVENPLRIFADDEVTVDFDYFHHHFGSFLPKENWKETSAAQPFVDDILAEKICIVSWWNDKRMIVSSYCREGKELALSHPKNSTRVRFRSWNGKLNKDISVNQ